MKNQFELVGGSIIGREHRRVGKNNQDAYGWTVTESGIVAVVCDGCSSGAHSEVGAKLGSKILLETLNHLIGNTQSSPNVSFEDSAVWQTVQRSVLTQLQSVANCLGGDRHSTVADYLLFTVVGVVVTPVTTAVFTLGDGVVAVNGHLTQLGSFPNNAPPYLGYGLLQENIPDSLQLKALQVMPTESVQTVLIGSDGVSDLIQAAESPLPGCSEPVGEIKQFWQGDRYFRNPDQVRRRLTRMNRDVLGATPSQSGLRQAGLLPDDTTLIVIRKTETS